MMRREREELKQLRDRMKKLELKGETRRRKKRKRNVIIREIKQRKKLPKG